MGHSLNKSSFKTGLSDKVKVKNILATPWVSCLVKNMSVAFKKICCMLHTCIYACLCITYMYVHMLFFRIELFCWTVLGFYMRV
jgi:hypothetical protein